MIVVIVQSFPVSVLINFEATAVEALPGYSLTLLYKLVLFIKSLYKLFLCYICAVNIGFIMNVFNIMINILLIK